MAISQVKLRTLYIMQILLEKTDENHIMSAADIDSSLASYGMSADRKTIYSDIETLIEFGLDIVQVKGAKSGYYIGSRKFEIAELKLLVDAVQSSKFITSKKSEKLIAKLETLTSDDNAKQLHRNVVVYNRPKTVNETIYYNVDYIHAAILENHKVSFVYTEWNLNKELQERHNGERYLVSPWALTWDDENYYLIAYDEKDSRIKHFRVDKMRSMNVVSEERIGKEYFKDFDPASYAKKTFKMFGGQDTKVNLRCHNSIIGIVLDRFGTDVIIAPDGAEHFIVSVTVSISPQFFGWITGIGKKMKIAGPEDIRNEYREYLKDVLGEYN